MPYADLDLDLDGVGQIAVVGMGPEGSNGAGKSTLLDAVLWSLYGIARLRDGKSRASSDDLIREGCQRTLVETTWTDAAGRVLVVTRKRDAKTGKSDLTLWVNGENRTRATIADTQTAIEEAVGLPARALLAGPVMAQNESDALMAADPAERKEILARLFELERYAEWAEAAKAAANRAAAMALAAQLRVDRLQSVVDEELTIRALRRDADAQVAAARQRALLLGEKVNALREEAIRRREHAVRVEGLRKQDREWSAQIDRATAQLADLDNSAAEMQEALDQSVPSSTENDFQRLEELEQVTRRYLDASAQADLVESVPCGGRGDFAGCQFIIRAAVAAEERDPLEERVLALGGPLPVDEITSRKRTLRALDRERAALAERQDQARRWFEREGVVRLSLETQIAEARTRVREARETLTTLDKDTARAALVAEQLAEAVAAHRLAEAEVEDGIRQQGIADERFRLIRTAKEELGIAKTEWDEAAADEARHRVLAKAFGRDGIPTLILENGIPLIEARANELLGRMPGGFSVRLVTQRETKAGTQRETLDIVVGIAGRQRAYAMLSGGERLRVDFALRVALADVLVRRGGKSFETLWIDEGFGTQDRLGREALLEAISAVAEDFGLIVVVSHMDDITDRFETRVVVTKDGDGISTAEVMG